jgi:hypothetical protein
MVIKLGGIGADDVSLCPFISLTVVDDSIGKRPLYLGQQQPTNMPLIYIFQWMCIILKYGRIWCFDVQQNPLNCDAQFIDCSGPVLRQLD